MRLDETPSKFNNITESIHVHVSFYLTESFGNFTFEMSLFKSGDFREHYTEYPIGPIDVGTDIFLQVTVRSNDTGVIVFVDECKATATPNYDDEMQFVFLEDGYVCFLFVLLRSMIQTVKM